MKTKNYLTLASFLLSTGIVSGQSLPQGFVSTSFWSAPQASSLEGRVEFTQGPKHLLDACRWHKATIDDGYFDKGMLERARMRVMPYLNQTSFRADFSVSELETLVVAQKKDAATEKLPMYDQGEALTSASLASLEKLTLVAAPGSLTEISRSHNLADSQIVVNRNQTISVYGSDVACDLLEGKVELHATAVPEVSLPNPSYDELINFYMNSVQVSLTEVFSAPGKESDVVKAARIGYRIGSLLADHNRLRPELTETQLGNLFDTLFIPGTLKSSSSLVDSEGGKKKEVQVYKGTLGKPVTVRLRSN